MFRARYGRIVVFFARATLSLVFWELALPAIGSGGLTRRTRPRRLRRQAARFRTLAVRMGGVLIKVGQFLSSRLDVLPEEITSELAGLQDEVPAGAFADIRRSPRPSSGAAQRAFPVLRRDAAGRGLARPGPPRTPASVRWRRPHAGRRPAPARRRRQGPAPQHRALIATDLAALRTVGRWLHRVPPIRRRADIPALWGVRAHPAAGSRLRRGGSERRGLRRTVPGPGRRARAPCALDPHDTARPDARGRLRYQGHRPRRPAPRRGSRRVKSPRGCSTPTAKQIFRDGFFHGDPHPGNLFVAPLGGGRWQLTFVDFGMIGHLTPATVRAGLREAAIAVGTKDPARLVRAWQRLGGLLPGTDLALIERVEARVFERLWGKTMTELWRDRALTRPRELLGEFRERALCAAVPDPAGPDPARPHDGDPLGHVHGSGSRTSTSGPTSPRSRRSFWQRTDASSGRAGSRGSARSSAPWSTYRVRRKAPWRGSNGASWRCACRSSRRRSRSSS